MNIYLLFNSYFSILIFHLLLGQAEITCFCLFRDVRVSSIFPCVTPGVERFSVDLCRAVKKCRKCILEVGCMGKGAGLGFECIEFVIAGFFLFFSFSGGGKGPGAPCFSK